MIAVLLVAVGWAGHEVCDIGADDDGDALVDCEDGDCSSFPSCIEDCVNGVDDDLDGLVDCGDDDCWGLGKCDVAAWVESGALELRADERAQWSWMGSGSIHLTAFYALPPPNTTYYRWSSTSTLTERVDAIARARSVLGRVRVRGPPGRRR